MILLVHSAPTTLARYRTPNLGVFSSPRRFYRDVAGWPWAADNDAYSAWDENRYLAMLNGVSGLPGCLFVTAPDVVGDAGRTLDLFYDWWPELRRRKLPIALVAQDGLAVDDVPWVVIRALFVGGTNEWKMGDEAAKLVRETKRRGRWAHMGRVNSFPRIRYAKAIGCDSVDGRKSTLYKDVWLRRFLRFAAEDAQMILRPETELV